MNQKKYFMFAIAIICLISILPTALGTTEISVSTEAELLNNISMINTLVNTGGSVDSYVITVTDNITLTKRIYFHNAHITIQGIPNGNIVITRAANFAQGQDTARGTFNPGMLEVAVYADGGTIYYNKDASITLKNITFDDAGNPDKLSMTNLIPASYGLDQSINGDRIYDSILSAYDKNATIILDKGAHLKNPGGWSAIYIAGASCIMEEGSSITGGNNDSFYLIRLASASNLTFNGTMESNTNRGAIFVDAGGGGDIFVNGIIKENTFKNHGIVFLNNQVIFGPKSTLTKNSIVGSFHLISMNSSNFNLYGNITENAGGDSVIFSQNPDSTNRTTLNVYGHISNNSLTHAIYGNSFVDIIIQETGKISNNTNISAGTIYAQSGPHVKVYGEISGNKARAGSDNGGGIYFVHGSSGELFSTGNISNNEVGRSGGGVYVNHNSTFTMHGGIISGNKALGLYSNSKDNGDYGGGGASVIRNSIFIMDGGTISNNEAAIGGGVWISGKTSGLAANSPQIGSTFIFNGGTIKDNIATNNIEGLYGADIALVACNGTAHFPSSQTTGHHVRISKNANIGEGFIGIAQTDSSNNGNIAGYRQAIYPFDKVNNNMFVGTLSQSVEGTIVSAVAAQTTGYTKVDQSLWIASDKTSGKINFATDFPNLNDSEYMVAIASLDGSLNVIGTPTTLIPLRSNEGLSIDITAASGASGYGIVIFEKIKAGPFDLTTSYAGNGEFKFQTDPDNDNKVTLNLSETADIIAVPDNGWYIKSITLTAGDGSIFTKTAVNGIVTVKYNELAAGTNNIHAVFEKNTGGSGSGTGAGQTGGSNYEIEEKSAESKDPTKPITPLTPDGEVATKVIQMWMMAIAMFVFVVWFEMKKEEK